MAQPIPTWVWNVAPGRALFNLALAKFWRESRDEWLAIGDARQAAAADADLAAHEAEITAKLTEANMREGA